MAEHEPRVRPLDALPPEERRRTPAGLSLAGAVVAVLLGWIVLVSGSDGAMRGADTELEGARESLARRDEAENQALLAGRRLAESLHAGDVDAAVALLSDDWFYLEVPGTAGALRRRAGMVDPRPALAFMAASVRVDPGSCALGDTGPSDWVEHAVVCDDMALSGVYAEALGVDGSKQRLVIGIVEQRVVSLFWSTRPERQRLATYCVFAIEALPALAADGFDADCRPVETEASAATHRRLATAFVAAGAPDPGMTVLRERRSLTVVENFVAAHNEGGEAARYVGRDFSVVRFPGLLLDSGDPPFPRVDDFLDWSAEVYDIELGSCVRNEADGGRSYVRIDCADAAWAGPLPEALGLDPVIQPIGFLVDAFEIAGLYGDTAPELREAFAAMCAWAQTTTPALVPAAFDRDCVPTHDHDGAAALLAIAYRYRATG